MTDTFTWNPEFGCEMQETPKVRTTQFDDGYEQRQAYGLNIRPQIWPLTFAQRSNDETNAILAFLRGKKGVTAVSWTTPYGDTILVKAANWKAQPTKYNLNTLTVTFTQVFEP
jgi:phage-related protein